MLTKTKNRGFACVGLYNVKTDWNIGGALRAASCYGANLVVVRGKRYKKLSTDTAKTWKHIPLIHAETQDIMSFIPKGAIPVGVELVDRARSLFNYVHPERAFYIFGPEYGSLPQKVLDRCRDVIYIPTKFCMNLAATANVVLYDRMRKESLNNEIHL